MIKSRTYYGFLVLCLALLGAASPQPDSVFQVESKWQTQDGQVMQLKELQGKPTALAFFYSTCKAVCPLIVNTMQGVEKKLHSKSKINSDFVLVSLDPSTDTVETLKSFSQLHKLSSDHWHLLHGSTDEVRALSVLMQAKYAPSADKEIIHSNFITVLDPEGRILGSAPGVPENVDTLVSLYDRIPATH